MSFLPPDPRTKIPNDGREKIKWRADRLRRILPLPNSARHRRPSPDHSPLRCCPRRRYDPLPHPGKLLLQPKHYSFHSPQLLQRVWSNPLLPCCRERPPPHYGNRSPMERWQLLPSQPTRSRWSNPPRLGVIQRLLIHCPPSSQRGAEHLAWSVR